MKKKILLFVAFVMIAVNIQNVLAWTEPSKTPPLGNVAAPINTGTKSQVKQGNLGLGLNSQFCIGTRCTKYLGPWALKTQRYSLSASDCGANQNFTSWESKMIMLPKYTTKVTLGPQYWADEVCGYDADAGNTCTSAGTFGGDKGTWAHILAVVDGEYKRIAYEGSDCKANGDFGTTCGWGDKNPGDHYFPASSQAGKIVVDNLKGASFITFEMIGYCPKYGSKHNAYVEVEYWGPMDGTIDTNSELPSEF